MQFGANIIVFRAPRRQRVEVSPNHSGIRASSGQRQGCLPNAILFGWIGVDFRSVVESGSTLVQLGRLHPYDQTTTPFSGRHFDHRHPPWPSAVFHNCQGTLEEPGLEIPSWRTLADTPPAREAGAEPENRRWVGSIARHDAWKSNTSGCSCGALSRILSAH